MSVPAVLIFVLEVPSARDDEAEVVAVDVTLRVVVEGGAAGDALRHLPAEAEALGVAVELDAGAGLARHGKAV